MLAGFSREAMQITLDKGRRRIRDLASSLKMVPRAEAASRLFSLAVERNFHKGRRMANVCCACLYVVCRQNKTPHMLIDFADVLETNVYVLGHTFLKLAQLLSIALPIIDPSLYIHRFASNLEFGEKTHAVAMTALRLLARMRREWMSYGRRPAGLCGAALMTAAKMHNFYRTKADVIRVVRIGNVALRERLQELHQTPTAELTVAQIEAGGGDDGKEDTLCAYISSEACYPPAFRHAQKRLRKMEAEKRKKLAEAEAGTDEIQKGPVKPTDGEDADEIQKGPVRPADSAEDDELAREVQSALASDELKQLDYEAAVDAQQNLARAQTATAARPARPAAETDAAGTKGDADDEGDGEDGGKERASNDDELSELDDDDVAIYLNTEEEYEQKKEIWQEVNKEYLEQQAHMERMKVENPEEYRKLRPSRSSKKKRRADAADEAPAKRGRAEEEEEGEAVKQPAPSSKLNYDAIKSLGGPGGFGVGSPAGRRPPLPPASGVARVPSMLE